ncbi:MAG TPA: pitrilysin family protein [Bryobacteraceae bacterium]|jgi:zinc protease|nr:pitrilysin family protein [Bryobacteraceae bacterium]
MLFRITFLPAALLLSGFAGLCTAQTSNSNDVTRATLDNGLRVVIVRDPLAPVATVEDNYLVGANETPAGFPGTAHAQEHMAFRGCTGLTADQIAAIYAQLGGYMDADTQQNITQYFVTVPAADLEVALRVDAACMSGVEDSQEQWAQERGAIEQEVARDLSNPTYKFITRLNKDLFADTPYQEDALGTNESFDKTTGEMLKKFYSQWYAPNNAILVVTGDVDPAATLATIKRLYGPIPRRQLPAHPEVNLRPVPADSFTLDSNLPYLLTFISYRFPGTDSPDFAAARVLSDVLSSQRADLYGLVPQGKALGTDFAFVETYPKASAAFAIAALPAGADPASLDAEIKKILANYATQGVPADLVEAAKKGEVAGAEFGRNSITNLAALWSQALAAEGRQSPDDDVAAIKRVSVDDVNRVAKKYILQQDAIVANLKPTPSGEAVSSKGFGGTETVTSAPTKPVALPDWAEAAVKSLRIPEPNLHPTDMTLANGLRLIVQTEKTSPTVTLLGSIKTQTQLETAPGKDGVSDVLEGLFSYGTKTLDRLAFQKELDDIAAGETAGSSFNLKVLKQDFARGVELLADNELHPALPPDAFKVVQEQTAQLTAGQRQSPGYRMDRALVHALLPPGDPLQRETTPQTVSSLSYDDVTRYYQKTFRPDLATIVVIGDVTPEYARNQIEKYFGAWQAAGAKPQVVLPPVPQNKPSAVNVPDASQIQDTVNLSEELEMNRFSPDYYALQVGDHVLGGGFYATRLYRDLREKAGYVYNIDDSLQASETRATYTIDYGCDPQNVSKARALVEQELVSMQKADVTPAELQQSKALLLRRIPLGESSEDAVAGGLIARSRVGLPLDEPIRAAQLYFNMTAAQVRAAFAKWIDPASFVQVVRGPAPQ